MVLINVGVGTVKPLLLHYATIAPQFHAAWASEENFKGLGLPDALNSTPKESGGYNLLGFRVTV